MGMGGTDLHAGDNAWMGGPKPYWTTLQVEGHQGAGQERAQVEVRQVPDLVQVCDGSEDMLEVPSYKYRPSEEWVVMSEDRGRAMAAMKVGLRMAPGSLGIPSSRRSCQWASWLFLREPVSFARRK